MRCIELIEMGCLKLNISDKHFTTLKVVHNSLRDSENTYAGACLFGYQGSEKDPELMGGSYTTFFRNLDPRIGRWLSPDVKKFPWQSSYVSMDCNPVALMDIWGASTKGRGKGGDKSFQPRSKRQALKGSNPKGGLPGSGSQKSYQNSPVLGISMAELNRERSKIMDMINKATDLYAEGKTELADKEWEKAMKKREEFNKNIDEYAGFIGEQQKVGNRVSSRRTEIYEYESNPNKEPDLIVTYKGKTMPFKNSKKIYDAEEDKTYYQPYKLEPLPEFIEGREVKQNKLIEINFDKLFIQGQQKPSGTDFPTYKIN